MSTPMLLPKSQVLTLDSSKVKDYQTCPRKFFFRHVRGWAPATMGHDLNLVFGSAYHAAHEKLLELGYEQENIPAAMEAFEEIYREVFGPEDDLANDPKNPGNAETFFRQSLSFFADRLYKYRAKWVEVAGVVPISPSHVLHFKCDAILANAETGSLLVIDHKTTRTDSLAWEVGFYQSFQMLAYLHAARMIQDKVEGIEIWGAILRKGGNKLKVVPIRASDDRLEEWLYWANRTVEEIEQNYEAIDSAASVLPSFPKNTESCTKYFRPCEFLEVCMSCKNPATLRCPPAYEVNPWDPREEYRGKIHLEDILEEKGN